MAKTFMVVGSGNADIKQLSEYALKSDRIIACDGGMGSCKKAGIIPDVILGDFDSAAAEDRLYFEQLGVEQFTYPAKKDMTDSELGISLAEDRGAQTIYMLGLTGTRLDHTITNIHLLLKPLKKGIRAIIADKCNTIELTDGTLDIDGEAGQLVSLIPLTQSVTGINTKNLEYPLTDGEMQIGASLGVSNVMTAKHAQISIKSGILMVIKSHD